MKTIAIEFSFNDNAPTKVKARKTRHLDPERGRERAMTARKDTEAEMTHLRPTHTEISARAYQIYLERGCQPGHDMDDWLQAEYELMQLPVRKLAELELPKPSTGRRKRSIIDVVRAAMY
jgi:hypothetical protein